MPTPTLPQLSLLNLGPLTTTFTPPSSCTPTTPNIYLAPTAQPSFLQWSSICSSESSALSLDSCLPPGDLPDDDSSSAILPYYSPGLHCPDTYTTAGIAGKDSNGDVVSVAGVFSVEGEIPYMNPIPNQFVSALNPGETAVVCCPEGFDGSRNGGCSRGVDATGYTAPTGCSAAGVGTGGEVELREGETLYGMDATVTYGVMLEKGDGGEEVTTTTFKDGEVAAEYTGWVVRDMVWLVRTGEDEEGKGARGGRRMPVTTMFGEGRGWVWSGVAALVGVVGGVVVF